MLREDYLFKCDELKKEGARRLGNLLIAGMRLGASSGAMTKSQGGGHVTAAAQRIAKAEESAGHEDRPDQEHRLSAAQHRRLAGEHEARSHAEHAVANPIGAWEHETAANAHHRAAQLASERHSDAALASYKAREATRNANRYCGGSEQVSLETAKAAAFGSQAVQRQTFREPQANPYAFQTSGRVSGGPREAGDDNDPSQPAHPLAFLIEPANDPRNLSWSLDAAAPGRERSSGIDYDPTRPAKAAGGSLTDLAKARLPGSVYAPLAKSLDLAHALTVAGKLPETAYRAILRLRDFKARASKSTYRNIQGDDDYRSTIRAIQAAAIEQADRETLLASIA